FFTPRPSRADACSNILVHWPGTFKTASRRRSRDVAEHSRDVATGFRDLADARPRPRESLLDPTDEFRDLAGGFCDGATSSYEAANGSHDPLVCRFSRLWDPCFSKPRDPRGSHPRRTAHSLAYSSPFRPSLSFGLSRFR